MSNPQGWQLPAAFEQAAAAGTFAADACIITWNPCDGYHLFRLSEWPAEKIISDFREGFGTHWRPMVEGPDAAPFAWYAMDTLDEAHDAETIPLDSPILWSPTGAHRMPWLLVDRPWKLIEEARRGLYTAWCHPPLRPQE